MQFEPNIAGRAGQFYHWIGVVETRALDPLKLGRMQIRILGWHTEDKTYIPTDELLWCHPYKGLDAATNGLGLSPMGPLEGDWVYGFFRDSESGQDPVVLGSIGGIPEEKPNPLIGYYDPGDLGKHILANWPRKIYYRYYPNDGSGVQLKSEPKGSLYPRSVHPWGCVLFESDTNRLARGEKIDDTIIGVQRRQLDVGRPHEFNGIPIAFVHPTPVNKWTEHPSPLATVYPFNKVYEDESGNLIEIDATPGAERIHVFHRSGTRIELGGGNNGADMQIKVGGESRSTYMRRSFIHHQNNCNITIDGECNIYVRSNVNMQVDGNMTVHVQGDYTEKVHGNYYTDIDGNRLVRIGGSDELDVVGNYTEKIGGSAEIDIIGNYLEKIGGNYEFDVKGNRIARIGGTDELDIISSLTTKIGGVNLWDVTGNRTSHIGGSDVLDVSGNHGVYVGGSETRNSGTSISDITGGSFTRNALTNIADVAGVSFNLSAGVNIHLAATGIISGDALAVHWNSGFGDPASPDGPLGPSSPGSPGSPASPLLPSNPVVPIFPAPTGMTESINESGPDPVAETQPFANDIVPPITPVPPTPPQPQPNTIVL